MSLGTLESTPAIPDTDRSERDVPQSADAKDEVSREELLRQGHALAESILEHTRRLWLCPFNRAEGILLDRLQKQFLDWQREAEHAGIDVRETFGDDLRYLRPVKPLLNPRKTMTWTQMAAARIAPRRREREDFAGGADFWAGLPAI